MNRQIIAGLFLAFTAAGCAVDADPVDPASTDDLSAAEGASELNSNPGDFCGGFAGIPCDNGLYCKYEPEAMCGAGDAGGTCAIPPAACQKVYKPVCGCDGQTYGNECEAASNSVSVAHKGECEATGGAGEGDPCGGLLGVQCAAGLFCDFPSETLCGSGDQMGICREPPAACLHVYKPVCGCDGLTYGNACEAAASSVSVLHGGPCK